MARILIIEDQAHLRKLYAEELEADGHEVVTVKSCETACRLLDKFVIDLVVMDVMLDEENGLEHVNDLLSRDCLLPIIIYTAYPTYQGDFHSWAATRFLTKSSDVTELKEAINQLLATEKIHDTGFDISGSWRQGFNAA
jgi:DNA-binding NtrC family response regulator